MTKRFIRNLWRWAAGVPELESDHVSLDELVQTEWSLAFEQLMRNRLIMGSFRYGRINAQFKPEFARVPAAIRRLDKYQRTGNLELLVDVACLCLLEFAECRHPRRHFRACGDEQAHVERA